MLRRVAPFLLVLGVQLALTARVAEAHLPPPAYLTIEIADERTDVHVVLLFDVFQKWCALAPGELARPGDLTAAQRTTLETSLRAWLRVRVDGLPADGVLQGAETERFEDHMVAWEYVKLHVRYPTQVPPKQIAFAWTRYASDGRYVFAEIDAELEAYGESSYPLFREREPEYVWHRPRVVPTRAPLVLPRPIEGPHVAVPVVSVALVLALLLGALFLRRPSSWQRVALALGVGLVAAVPLAGLARVDVPLPGSPELERPPAAEAIAIFASLHRGVYAALDGETEDEVYDSLATCVTGSLLPTLYLDIQGSLILAEEGGAVAKVQKTEILESSLLPPGDSEGPWFRVRARWRVVGKVGHWGHTHQRVNEYLAHVTVVATEGRWKIAAIDVLEEERVDDGKTRAGR